MVRSPDLKSRCQATVALEMLEDAPDLDAIVISISGGGLAAGVCLAVKALRPQCKGEAKAFWRHRAPW